MCVLEFLRPNAKRQLFRTALTFCGTESGAYQNTPRRRADWERRTPARQRVGGAADIAPTSLIRQFASTLRNATPERGAPSMATKVLREARVSAIRNSPQVLRAGGKSRRCALTLCIGFLALTARGAVLTGGVQCQEPEYAFEVGRRGDIVSHSFYLSNTSPEAAIVENVRTSCGCTVVSVAEGTQIPSKGSIEVPVQVRLDRPGRIESTVFLKIVGREDLITLTIEGLVHEDCPESVDFGTIKQNEGITRTFLVKRFQGQPDLGILELHFGGKFFSAEQTAPSDASAATIALHLKPGIPYGKFEDRLEILTNDTEVPTKRVTVKGYVLLPVEISEKSVYFGAIRGKTVSAKSVELSAPYGQELHLANVENTKEAIFSWRVDDKAPRQPDRVPIIVETTGEIPEGTPTGIVKGTLTFNVRVGDSDHRARVEVYGLVD